MATDNASGMNRQADNRFSSEPEEGVRRSALGSRGRVSQSGKMTRNSLPARWRTLWQLMSGMAASGDTPPQSGHHCRTVAAAAPDFFNTIHATQRFPVSHAEAEQQCGQAR